MTNCLTLANIFLCSLQVDWSFLASLENTSDLFHWSVGAFYSQGVCTQLITADRHENKLGGGFVGTWRPLTCRPVCRAGCSGLSGDQSIIIILVLIFMHIPIIIIFINNLSVIMTKWLSFLNWYMIQVPELQLRHPSFASLSFQHSSQYPSPFEEQH